MVIKRYESLHFPVIYTERSSNDTRQAGYAKSLIMSMFMALIN